MTDLEILADIKKIINEDFSIEIDDITEESRFDEDLGITDLDMEDLISTLEKKYDISFPQSALSSFQKLSDLTAYIYENVDNVT